MHSYLKAVGFSEIKKRAEMKEILLDVIRNYDEKNVVSDHPDGTFAEFSKSYGYDCGITVCGQYDLPVFCKSFSGFCIKSKPAAYKAYIILNKSASCQTLIPFQETHS